LPEAKSDTGCLFYSQRQVGGISGQHREKDGQKAGDLLAFLTLSWSSFVILVPFWAGAYEHKWKSGTVFCFLPNLSLRVQFWSSIPLFFTLRSSPSLVDPFLRSRSSDTLFFRSSWILSTFLLSTLQRVHRAHSLTTTRQFAVQTPLHLRTLRQRTSGLRLLRAEEQTARDPIAFYSRQKYLDFHFSSPSRVHFHLHFPFQTIP
jgi:hypothetical protein